MLIFKFFLHLFPFRKYDAKINKVSCPTTKLDIHSSYAKPTAILSYDQSISGDNESGITHTRNYF